MRVRIIFCLRYRVGYSLLMCCGTCCFCLSVRLSVTSRSLTKTAKRRITKTTPRGLSFFRCRKSRQKLIGVTANGGAKCRCCVVKCRRGSCILTTFDANRCQLSSVARLSHWASTLFVCSTFAVMQRVARVCQRLLILVTAAKEVMFSSLFVCLLATLCKNF